MNSAEIAVLKKRSWRGRCGVVALVLCWISINLMLAPVMMWIDPSNGDDEMMLFFSIAGIISGEACCLVILSGLSRRTWIGGYYLGLAIAVMGYAAILLGSWLADNYDSETWVGFFWLPGWLLVAAMPLLMCRQVLGWRLTARDEQLGSRTPFQLSYLFSFMALLAAALVLFRAPQVIMEEDDYWPPILISCGVLFGVGLLILPLAAKLAFGMRSRFAAFAGLSSLAMVVLTISFGIMQCFQSWDTPWSQRWEILPFLLSYVVPLFGVFYLSMGWLVWCGYVLHKTQKPLADKHDGTVQPAVSKWQLRLRIAAAVAVAIATSAAISRLEQWRRARDAEIKELEVLAEQLEGRIHASNRQVQGLTLSSHATDNDLTRFRVCHELTYLDVSNSKVTDAGLVHLQQFPKLSHLIANQTVITDAGLRHLTGLPLTKLELDGTSITGAGLAFVNRSLSELSANNSQFDDRGCEELAQITESWSVSLRGTRVTDVGLVHLAQLPSLSTLDVSGTDVAVGMPELHGFLELHSLYLDRTQVNDQGAATLSRLPNLFDLYLSGTAITDVGLRELARCRTLRSLNVSDTRISNYGVALLKEGQLLSLDLSGTDVTGDAFENGIAGSSILYLERTDITDEQLAILKRLSRLSILSLADTAITDAGLIHLVGMSIEHLDLSRTKVTPQGLMSHGLLGISSLSLDTDQFPPDVMAQIQQRFGDKLNLIEPGTESRDQGF